LRSSYHRFSKWRWLLKWLKNWFFDHNSVNFKHFCVLFFDLSLYLSRAYFTEEKFFLSNPRWRLMSNMPTEIQSSLTWEFSNIFTFCFLQCVFIFVSNVNQEHILSNESKMRFDPKWQIKIRFFYITLRVSNIFFFLHSFGVGKTQVL
jgi:hypothetical protein